MTAGDTAAADASAAAFERAFGHAPDGVWAAPGRVNLIGEYTDVNEGLVLPFALPRTVRAAASPRADGRLRLCLGDGPAADRAELSAADLAPGRVRGWACYPAGVLWALRAAGHPATGADVHLDGDVPRGAGLSSSAAMECAVALALDGVGGLGLSRAEIAALCRRAENEFVGVPCGIMDQTASARCVAGHALYLDTRDLTHRHVPLDPAAAGLSLLVVDTRVRHALADGAYADRCAGCEAGARALGVRSLRDIPSEGLEPALGRVRDPAVRALVRHVVTENDRVRQVVDHLEAGRVTAVGPVLTAGHASLRDDFAVSCPELDLAVAVANGAGALGARMTGGGFGGSAVALVESGAETAVAEAAGRAFAAAGHRAPRVFPAVAGEGARRLR
ncbi:galactokinase [Streptomyces albireticuli]|uniref:Galactokinase n=1 Tax=Streptomyces albireticuli TaxID=1940 RepID=A0A2A2D550_9ACTN|nr:galactokinase [Streptomyces albireticuli]MCD9144500.1 galactokinase [Streptomyces albireticuli]MCD9163437.1 galactokinase [Streptomyces albireticuli]MCD9193177.1 galactokinase [Streptomyces albireticuli]PAU46641.1 galactokinase [Streptomyces albireticuli]